MKISALLIARNEENKIKKCLQSLSFVDELILVTTMPLLIIITIATFAMIRVPMNRLSGAILFGFFGLFIYQLTL